MTGDKPIVFGFDSFADRVANVTAAEASAYIDRMIDANIPAKVGEKTDDGIEVILARSLVDTKFFALTFEPESFDQSTTYQHDQLWAMLDDECAPNTVVCAWRSFGKSTMLVIKKVKDICFRLRKFIMIVGKTFDYAVGMTEDIKAILLTNDRIRHVFGSMKAKTYAGNDLRFSQRAWFACDPDVGGRPICFVVPKGAQQPVRGARVRLANRMQRPDDITIDDLEDRREIDNEEIRTAIWGWLHGDLLPCVGDQRPDPKTNRWPANAPPPWRVFYADTLKHEASSMAKLLSDSFWKRAKLPQAELRTDPDGEKRYYSLVPSRISDAQVRAEVNQALSSNTIDEYCREKLCMPMSPEHAVWTRDMYRYYSDSDLKLSTMGSVDRFIVVDPAQTSKPESDYSGILAVAADCLLGRIYFRRLVNSRLKIPDLLDNVFRMAVETNSKVIAVETTGLQDHVKYLFETRKHQEGLTGIEFVWLKGQTVPQTGDYGTGKEKVKRARASMIAPFYQRGAVYHDESLRDSALEEQQLSFPKCAHWDALDCAGYVPQVLQYGGRFFTYREIEGVPKPQFADDADFSSYDDAIMNGAFCLN